MKINKISITGNHNSSLDVSDKIFANKLNKRLISEILYKLNGFEDLYLGKNLRDTNISLRLFSAKYSYFFGCEKMTTLTDNWL